MPMRCSDRLPFSVNLILVLTLYLLVGGLYAVYTPAWQAPDEPAHYNYVRYLAENGSFPVLRPGDYPHAYLERIKHTRFPPDMSVDPIRYEFWQPPWYYVLATPIYRLWGGALIPLRLFSVLLGAGVVVTAYAIALTIWPGDRGLALGTAAFVAFVPMHLTMMASVNNDALAELSLAVVMLRLMRFTRGDEPAARPYRYLTVSGLLLGLGLVTKATVYVAVPLALIALVLRQDRRPAILARRALALFGPALLLAVPWYIRNVTIYGWPDLLGTRNHDAVVVGQLRTADYLADVGWPTYLRDFVTTTFHSFWGQFGWMAVPMDRRVYLALGLLSALMVMGVALAAWNRIFATISPSLPAKEMAGARLSPQSWLGRPVLDELIRVCKLNAPEVILVGLWLIFTGLIYLYYNVSFVQFQGRYLFPALVPGGLFAALGLREILSRRWAWVGASVCGVAAVMIGVGSALGGDLDKWGLLIAGGATIALLTRRRLPARLDGWVVATPFAGLAALSAYSLFAFIIPYL